MMALFACCKGPIRQLRDFHYIFWKGGGMWRRHKTHRVLLVSSKAVQTQNHFAGILP